MVDEFGRGVEEEGERQTLIKAAKSSTSRGMATVYFCSALIIP